MAESLDKVLQPDGSYKWQLVDLNDTYVGRAKAEPAKEPVKEPAEQARPKRRTKFSDTPTETPDF